MAQFQIYLDEDASRGSFARALRSRGVQVLTIYEADMAQRSDSEQLSFAGRDFQRIHTEWLQVGRSHAGIIVAPQQRFSVGEQTRRVLHIRDTLSADAMRNRIEFLGTWS